MKKLADLTKLSEVEWLLARRRGIGSSDAAAVLEVSPWRTPLAVFMEKTGLGDPVVETEMMRWGKLLEPVVADEYARETGRLVEHPHALYQHDTYPFILATPDRFATMPTTGERLVVEIKTAGAAKADDWRDEPPIHYQVQTQHLLAVTGFAIASLVVLIGGQQLLWTDVPRNDAFIAAMLEREREFWRRVELLDPPTPTGADQGLLATLYPRDQGAAVALPAEATEWDARLRDAKETIKKAEAIKDECEARLKGCIGVNTFGVLPEGGGRYSWKASDRHEAPREARTLTIRTLRRLTT